MSPQHLTATVAEEGVLVLRDPRLHRGAVVDVIVLPAVPNPPDPRDRSRQLLGATPYAYTDPTEPVAEDDWEVLK